MSIRSLWAAVQENPIVMRHINGWLTVFWIAMVPLSNITGWVDSVKFVSNLSIVALVLGNLAAWQASRVEVRQEKENGA